MELLAALCCGLSGLVFALVVAVRLAGRLSRERDAHLAALTRALGLSRQRGRRDPRATWYAGELDGRPVAVGLWAERGLRDPASHSASTVFFTNIVVGAAAELDPDVLLWRRQSPAHHVKPVPGGTTFDQAFDAMRAADQLPPRAQEQALAFVHRWPALRLRPLDAAWADRLPASWPADQGATLVMTDLRTARLTADELRDALHDLALLARCLEQG